MTTTLEQLITITNWETDSISFNDGTCDSDKIIHTEQFENNYLPYTIKGDYAGNDYVTIDQFTPESQMKYILEHINEAECEDKSLCSCGEYAKEKVSTKGFDGIGYPGNWRY